MHAPVVGRRGGFRHRDEVSHFVMSDFALTNDHAMMLQGRDKSKMYPANSGLVLQESGIRNNTFCGDGRATGVVSHGKGDVCPQAQKNDVAVPMSAEARLFSAEGYAGTENGSVRPQDEQRNKGNDLLLFDWPELSPLEDFETSLRKLDSPFEIGSNYFDDPMWPSICSPDAQLVPSIHFDNDPISSSVANKPILQSTVPVPDSTDQINMANPSPPLQIEHFPPLSDADLLCPFDDMLVPTASSTMYCNDEIIPSSVSGPDELASAYAPQSSAKKKKPHATTPDMFLDEMSENPLEMYFPQLTTYEQPKEVILPEVYFAGDDGAAMNSSDLEFGSKGRRCSGRSRENPLPPATIIAAPVKNLRFQKLQEGMNQLDVGTKTCIRDALYRLANNVEQRHCADQNMGSSGAANRFKTSSVWAETQGSPMDRSVAKLLLHKPLYRKTTDRHANRVA